MLDYRYRQRQLLTAVTPPPLPLETKNTCTVVCVCGGVLQRPRDEEHLKHLQGGPRNLLLMMNDSYVDGASERESVRRD